GLPPVDAVLFCVKSCDTERAAAQLRPVIGPETAVVSLQNGVDNEDTIDAILGAGTALGGVAQVFTLIDRPGVIVHHFAGRIIFGELDGRRSPRAERLLRAFEGAGIAVELTTSVSAFRCRPSSQSTRRSRRTPRGGADGSEPRALATPPAVPGPLRARRPLPRRRDARLAGDPLHGAARDRRAAGRRVGGPAGR